MRTGTELTPGELDGRGCVLCFSRKIRACNSHTVRLNSRGRILIEEGRSELSNTQLAIRAVHGSNSAAGNRVAIPVAAGVVSNGVGTVHVVTAAIAIALGIAIFIRRKGDHHHRALGLWYVAAMMVVNLSVIRKFDGSARPGAFHMLGVISILTTALGWLPLRKQRRDNRAVQAHASFMTWSWIGAATAGLAQAANQLWPQHSPWPVTLVIAVATATGLMCVPRFVSRYHRLHSLPSARPTSTSS